jgi:hypothetical protein
VLYNQLMATLKSENAISDDLVTSKFQKFSARCQPWWHLEELSLAECKHVKVVLEVFYTPPKYFGMCAPDTKYFNVLPPPKKETQSCSEKW